MGISGASPYLYRNIEKGKKAMKSWYQYIFLGERPAGIEVMRAQVGRDSEGTGGHPVSCLELELEGELDRTRPADLVERIEAAVRTPGAQAAR